MIALLSLPPPQKKGKEEKMRDENRRTLSASLVLDAFDVVRERLEMMRMPEASPATSPEAPPLGSSSPT